MRRKNSDGSVIPEHQRYHETFGFSLYGAKLVGADNLGSPSEVKAASAGPKDPFVREFFPELSNKNTNGML